MVDIVGVKLLESDVFLSFKDRLFSFLPINVVDKLTFFKHLTNMQRSLWGEILVRKYISDKFIIKPNEITIENYEKGKPYVKDNLVHFNISHSGDWVLAAFSDNEVGIDVEHIHNVNYDIASRFFSPKECNDLFGITNEEERKSYFFDLWTIKESYLKAIGTGLTKPLNTFTISFNENNISLIDDENPFQNVFFKQYFINNEYKITVCSFLEEFPDNIKILTLDDILTL